MFLTVTDGSSANAATTYINAHSLLPRTELEAAIKPQPTPREAMATLRNDRADPGKVLHAIVVLGHVPSPEAYEALMAHAKSDRVHADVAKCAADECAGWMAGCPDELAGMDALRAAASN